MDPTSGVGEGSYLTRTPEGESTGAKITSSKIAKERVQAPYSANKAENRPIQR